MLIRRALAFSLDWVLFGLWGALVGVVVFLAGWTALWDPGDPLRMQLFTALVTTLPFGTYFVLSEASRGGASCGKMSLGLRVLDRDGARLSLGAAIARTALKLLPWELGHAGTHHIFAAVAVNQDPPLWALGLNMAAMGIIVASAFCIPLAGGRAFHDLVLGSRVVRFEEPQI